jgi:hypothetical protein
VAEIAAAGRVGIDVEPWAAAAALSPIELDCVTAVQLKILDGKCKMNPAEKAVMARIYDVTKTRPGKLLGDDVHRLIAAAYRDAGESMKMRVYEQRLYAETMIGRPTMKAFKAMLRTEGLIGIPNSEA